MSIKHEHVLQVLTVFAIGLIAFLNIGAGHSLLVQQAVPHQALKMSHDKPCQSACVTSVNEKKEQILTKEDDIDPDPAFTIANNQLLQTNLIYSVAFAALLLAFLKRKPPDLIVEYAKFRN